jgi:hypothetical protein
MAKKKTAGPSSMVYSIVVVVVVVVAKFIDLCLGCFDDLVVLLNYSNPIWPSDCSG